jgi:two-component system chemotaxis response regulator CheB
MDVNMPVMDGSTALKHIMIGSPCPVLIMSNLLPSSYNTLLSFLNLGAADFMSKPVKTSNIVLQQQRIVERVHNAAKANMGRFQLMRRPKLNPSKFIQVDEKTTCNTLVIINSGAGGYLEMVNLVTALPNVSSTGVLSLQSIPPRFAPTLSTYLNVRSRFEVKPFKDKAILNVGRCYIGTNGKPILFRMENGLKIMRNKQGLEDDAPQESVDGILSSAADIFKDRVLVILLSGGDIGTMDGLRAVKSAGGKILAPKPEKSILPESFMGTIDADLVTELFDTADLQDVLVRYCR